MRTLSSASFPPLFFAEPFFPIFCWTCVANGAGIWYNIRKNWWVEGNKMRLGICTTDFAPAKAETLFRNMAERALMRAA